MQIRDRIKELRRVKASELRPNPKNWRRHPQRQHDALRGVLAEVGYADALLVRELNDGSLEIIDGHLRAEATPNELVPVLVLDVDAAEADKLLATHDMITGLAETDFAQLATLAAECNFDSPAVQAMFSMLDEAQESESPASEPALTASYQVVATCDDEAEQQALYERLTAEGYRCRLLML
jgi:hypothetical protein